MIQSISPFGPATKPSNDTCMNETSFLIVCSLLVEYFTFKSSDIHQFNNRFDTNLGILNPKDFITILQVKIYSGKRKTNAQGGNELFCHFSTFYIRFEYFYHFIS